MIETSAKPQLSSAFSAFFYPQVEDIVVCGVEAHACVQATALDFLHRGFRASKKIYFSIEFLDQKIVTFCNSSANNLWFPRFLWFEDNGTFFQTETKEVYFKTKKCAEIK
jgi:hypothetical protein